MGGAGLYNLSIIIKNIGEPGPTQFNIIEVRIKRTLHELTHTK